MSTSTRRVKKIMLYVAESKHAHWGEWTPIKRIRPNTDHATILAQTKDYKAARQDGYNRKQYRIVPYRQDVNGAQVL